MAKYQEIAQMLDSNAINNVVDAYNKGRADAIEDFAKEVEYWCWKNDDYIQDDLNELMEIAEKLKEDNDEN